jgi:hypothetical protein
MKIRKNITAAKSRVGKTKEGPCPRSGRPESKKLTLNQMEKLAADVTTEFLGACGNLRELKPKIDQIRSYYQENVRGSVTLAGCRYFHDFCKMHLHRTPQAVYKMLSSDSDKQQEKKNVPKSPTTHRKPVISKADTERLRAACLAAARHFDAEDTGNTPEASKAKAEFFTIFHTLRFFETGGARDGRQRSLYRDGEGERQRIDRVTSTALPISSSTPPPLSSPPLSTSAVH